MSARAEVLRSLHRAKLAAKKLRGRRSGVSAPRWNEATMIIEGIVPKLAHVADLLERPRDRALRESLAEFRGE